MQVQKYYFVGGLFLVIFWLISWRITGEANPFAMAKGSREKGENDNLNASLVQMIVFTMLTVFAYTTVFAARAMSEGGALIPTAEEWLKVPTNLLILMGISVGTAVASRAIRVQQKNNENPLTESNPTTDASSLTTDKDGRTDLIKIQMLIWTVIAVVVYLTILSRFMINGCFQTGNHEGCSQGLGNSLPDIDSAFMVLLGVSQGGYVVNKLSENPPADNPVKRNESVEPPDKPGIKGEITDTKTEALNPSKQGQIGDCGKIPTEPATVASILVEPQTVNLTAASQTQQLTAAAADAQNNPILNLSGEQLQWSSDDVSVATVNDKGLVTRVATGNCKVRVAVDNGATVSNECSVICS